MGIRWSLAGNENGEGLQENDTNSQDRYLLTFDKGERDEIPHAIAQKLPTPQ